jgi:hypothetical protein
MKNWLAASMIATLGGCSAHAAAPRAQALPVAPERRGSALASGGSVSGQLLHDVQSAPQLYDIRSNIGDGLGHYALRFEGKPVWPPRGARCTELVRCCQELATMADSLALACLLATARDQNCRLARKTSVQIATEQGHQPPASCVQ